eukprot:PhF_6_TR7034/c2_g1_i5/m.10550
MRRARVLKHPKPSTQKYGFQFIFSVFLSMSLETLGIGNEILSFTQSNNKKKMKMKMKMKKEKKNHVILVLEILFRPSRGFVGLLFFLSFYFVFLPEQIDN